MSEWQPTETAPHDEPVLCCLSYGVGVLIAHTPDGKGPWITDGGTEFPRRHIVAWMPLPEPPSDTNPTA